MAHTPRFKVFDPDGNYIGCAKGADEAVVLARYKGVGATVRDGHASERKRLESQADMRKPFSVYGARSGKKRDLARVQRLTKRDPTK